MTAPATRPPGRARLRRWILLTVASLFAFGLLHHLDHALRGNHVGWPLIGEINPFTYSLMAYPLMVLGLAWMTRGRVWAGYWFAYGILALLLIGTTHFIPPFIAEPIRDVYGPWLEPAATDLFERAPAPHAAWFEATFGGVAGPALAVTAVTILVSAVVSAVMLVAVSLRVRRVQGHW